MTGVRGERYPGIAGTIQISQFQWCSRAENSKVFRIVDTAADRGKKTIGQQ